MKTKSMNQWYGDSVGESDNIPTDSISEGFDFSGMSDVDYTDHFADIDQDAEELAEFERSIAPAAGYWGGYRNYGDGSEISGLIRFGERFGDEIRPEKKSGGFCLSVRVNGFTSVILDLDKVPADIYEYSVVPDGPLTPDDGRLFLYILPRADGTLSGSPSWVDGDCFIVPAWPRVTPFWNVYWPEISADGPDPFRRLRSLAGAPRQVGGNFGFLKILSMGGSDIVWRTEIRDLTGSPDIVGGSADFSHNCCGSLVSAKGAPAQVGMNLILSDSGVRPWAGVTPKPVPLFGDGRRREIRGRIMLTSPDVNNSRRGGNDIRTVMADLGRPGTGRYNNLAGMIADNCSCDAIYVEMADAYAASELSVLARAAGYPRP